MKCFSIFALVLGCFSETAFGGIQNLKYQSETFVISGFPGEVKITAPAPHKQSSANVVLVIDDSGSTQSYHGKLVEHASVLVSTISKLSSVNVAATTTSSNDPSGVPKFFSAQDPNFASKLAMAFQPGTSGNGIETPLLSLRKLVDTYPSFFKDTPTIVITVTDAEDQSVVDVGLLVTDLEKLTGGKSSLSAISVIIPSSVTAPTCQRDDPKMTPQRLEQFTSGVNGKVINLCDTNFVDQISKTFLGLVDGGFAQNRGWSYTQIPLPSKPKLQTIVVRWGATVLKGGDELLGWIFNESTNQIILGRAIDWEYWNPNAPIEVTYKPVDW